MAARGYATVTTSGQVSKWLGADLTAAQTAQAAAWLEVAENTVDAATGQPFATGAVTGERYIPDGPYLWLRKAPVSPATPIVIKGYQRFSTTPTTLVLTNEYEVDDWATGRVYLPGWAGWAYVTVDYLPVAAVPAAIQEATAALLADWLANGGPGAPTGDVIGKRFDVAEVRYAAVASPSAAATDLPARVRQLLAPYLSRLTFA